MNHLKAIMAMAQFRQIVASADEHGKPSILLDMEVARSVLDAFDQLIGGDLMPFMTAVAKEVRHLGPEWGVEFGATEGNHVRVVVRHGQPGSRALLGELVMTIEEAHEFRAVVEPLGAHVTDVCGHCMGKGEVLFFYERPGGPPGNQTIPCPKCQAKPAEGLPCGVSEAPVFAPLPPEAMLRGERQLARRAVTKLALTHEAWRELIEGKARE